MPLIGRRKRANPPRDPYSARTASGRVIDLRDRETVTSLAMTRMAWQPVAWNYRNAIGELGQALRMKGNILSKVAFTAAFQPEGEDEPILLTGDPEQDVDEDGHPYVPERVARAAVECIAALPWGRGYSWTGRICTGFDVAGEVWLHGHPDADGMETWDVRSTSEIVNSSGGGIGVIEFPGRGAREIDPDADETLIRLWVPHPEWGELADSPLRTMLDVCEDVVLAGREIRAAAMSRLASNGILFIPEGMTMVQGEEGEVRVDNSSFAASFAAAMIAPINNEGHASAVVPMVVYGDPEDGQAIRHIPLDRRPDETVINRQREALDRIADSIDLPKEAMRGTLGTANHWSAWLIDAQTFENHLEPGCRLIADSITESYMRRRLLAPVSEGGWGLTSDEIDMVRCWYDASAITRNTNRSADADAAMDRGGISYKAYRAAKGFGEGDAPDEEDIQRLIAVKGAAPQDSMGQLLHTIAGIKEPEPPSPMVVPGEVVRPGQQQLPPGNSAPLRPGQAPTQGTPPTPVGARTAAAGPSAAQKCRYCAEPATKSLIHAEGKAYVAVCNQHVRKGTTAVGGPSDVNRVVPITAAGSQGVLDSVTVIDGSALADIDRELIERIRQAAEAEMAALLRKAGSKIKAQVQGKDKALAAQLTGMDPESVAAFVGYDRIRELGLTEDALLAAAFAYLAGKFTKWSTAAIKQSVTVLADLIGLPLVTVQTIATAMTQRIPSAWKKLEASLHERALNSLYGRKGDNLPTGEVPDTLVLPGDIREALTEIGGSYPGHAGGLALGGDLLREVDRRAEPLGFSWRYGVTPRERQFHPHKELAGERFDSYTAERLSTAGRPDLAWLGPFMSPGDHKGCMCDAVPAWAVDRSRAQAEAVTVDTPAMAGERLLAEIDDAAGRTGTHSQRMRDERDRMVEIQKAWIEGRAPRG